QSFGRIEPAVLAILGMGLQALVALNDARDGRLDDVEHRGDLALRFALHFDPLEDQVGIAVGLPGAARMVVVVAGGHGFSPKERISDFKFQISDWASDRRRKRARALYRVRSTAESLVHERAIRTSGWRKADRERSL